MGLGNLAAGVGDVMYSMLTPVDDRLLTMGWVLTSRGRNANGWYMSPVSRHDIAGIWVAFFSRQQRYRCGQGPADCLTVPRAVTFDAARSQLLVVPVDELSALRQEAIGSRSAVALAAGQSLALLESSATAFDLELTLKLVIRTTIAGVWVALPQAYQTRISCEQVPNTELAVDIALLTSGPTAAPAPHLWASARHSSSAAAVSSGSPSWSRWRSADAGGLTLGINATSEDPRHVSLSVGGGVVFAFTLPPQQDTLDVRALADRNVVEVFVASGRGVYTGAVNISAVAAPGAFVLARRPATVVSAKAWEMGCGWAAEPGDVDSAATTPEPGSPEDSAVESSSANPPPGVAEAAVPDATITVRPTEVIATLSEAMNGAGMEELNHEIYGGIYSQLIHGESFEEPPGPNGVSGENFMNLGNPSKPDDGKTSYITWQTMATTTTAVESGCNFSVSATALNGNQSQRIGCEGSACSCSLLNRGVDAIVSLGLGCLQASLPV